MSAMVSGIGATLELDGDAVVSVPAGALEELKALAGRHGVPVTEIGTTGGDTLTVNGAFDVPPTELRDAWAATLPAALG